ncbi:GNAT family N-acetyltransferase [Nocardia asteroides]|uniref:GNAT family N-acetyltransferase n=1 Tax=Nocardia asteroides TaxID=1824 RepID=UPI001E6178F5|nr:GNAT family N-acetyltransferase [Nocardia asteroides]UGT60015.1 GNAT family N-acetyltransferase [Nocardia asteroides]
MTAPAPARAVRPGTLLIRRARRDELALLCLLRLRRTRWLVARGEDQWTAAGRGLEIAAFARAAGRAIERGHTWVAELGGEVAGTITVDRRADRDLWTPAELAEAVIAHFMIVDAAFAGHGIGHRLLAHAAALARGDGLDWVRLDAWTTNAGLHAYYRDAGFHLARIAGPPAHGPSRALFERRVDTWPTTLPALRHPATG